jgi:hypothetical protein
MQDLTALDYQRLERFRDAYGLGTWDAPFPDLTWHECGRLLFARWLHDEGLLNEGEHWVQLSPSSARIDAYCSRSPSSLSGRSS